jgi:hypothetical protein
MRRLTAVVFDKNVSTEKEPKQIHPLAKSQVTTRNEPLSPNPTLDFFILSSSRASPHGSEVTG